MWIRGRREGILAFLLGSALGITPGLLIGASLRTGTPSRMEPPPGNVLAIARRRVHQARVRALAESSFAARQELLRQLCFLRELELNLWTDYGARPATTEELQPLSEQEALLDHLWRTARTPEQLYQCAQLEHRVYRSPQVAHGPDEQ